MIDVTNDDLTAARALRRRLHARPELSGQEHETARIIAAEMRGAGAHEVLEGLGGTGVAAVFHGTGPGRCLMIRAELDALPILEESGVPWSSEHDGVAHMCGHDGHMAILVALARALGRGFARGRVVLLFQPAEEDGAGAKAVLADPRTAGLAPDLVVSLHNLPGLPIGSAALADGPMGSASRGMRVRLTGREAHASSPEHGLSPRRALSRLMEGLTDLDEGTFPAEQFALVTVAGVSMGGTAFGVAPGRGELRATLRTLTDERMAQLVRDAEALVRETAVADRLGVTIDYHEVFEATSNHPEAVKVLRRALDAAGVEHGPEGQPWRPSEDFGRLSALAPAAMLFLGAGEGQPPLHDPRYDFPDALIEVGARIFAEAVTVAV
ncbi:amidohydrolase [Palleronia marisminoris]|uniref:N-acetyldiaminopimelate deacetylase n=1 Tax=Palleronia marisminoris TaxID=315423 RepID=A0A1Y5SX43_9RHOB|nr:amidohydrolase [Palleronia marisminoris]SFH05693.1 amidohydrolase [Palleronia marisminoris]SLN50828.1 N-acetyldiaminopimelate deacetylase [Palleronia marisminoris]